MAHAAQRSLRLGMRPARRGEGLARRVALALLLFAFGGVLGGALGCGGGSDPENCPALTAKLQSCGLATEGRSTCGGLWGFAESDCVRDCIDAASCDDLAIAACELTGPAFECAIAECLQSFVCTNQSDAIPIAWVCDDDEDCNDGSDEVGCVDFACTGGGSVPQGFQCDGEEDCADGSDELGCATATCSEDGSTIPEVWLCDFVDDCPAASDERNCPNIFVCDDGGRIGIDARCSGFDECMDSSDEKGCAKFECESGDEIPARWECDDFVDCEDFSDETGCAELICEMDA